MNNARMLTRTGWTASVFRVNWIVTFRDSTLSVDTEDLAFIAEATLTRVALVRVPALPILIHHTIFLTNGAGGMWLDEDQRGCQRVSGAHWTAVARQFDGVST